MENRSEALEALARSNVYGLLARVTRAELDQEMLAELRKPEVAEAFRAAGVDLTPTLSGPDDAALLESLVTGYTYVFLLNVNPHESVHRGAGQLWGPQTVKANAFMEEIGLTVSGEQSLLPDHVAIELEVMQHLTSEEAAFLAAGDAGEAERIQGLQRRYLQEHLGAWGVEFFGSVERAANHPFYAAMGRLGSSFLFTEVQALG